MIRLNRCFAVALAVLALACSQAAAAPMRCSGEEKICVADCNKASKGGTVPACVTLCGQRQALCVKTGCWDNGVQRFCGLLRQ